MDINTMMADSLYFGITLSLIAYWIGVKMQQKWKHPLVNPLLISIILIIIFLLCTDIDYKIYQYGASHLTFFLTPVTVCLAVPLYKQMQVLKDNIVAVVVSIGCGCVAHASVIIFCLSLFHTDTSLIASLLPKSITTAIALGVCSEIGGIQGVTVIGVCVAGLSGAIVGPYVLKTLKITDPVAQGLALGSSSHAIGTSKAIELGEIQAAMSSLAIVVTGLLTVILVPLIMN